MRKAKVLCLGHGAGGDARSREFHFFPFLPSKLDRPSASEDNNIDLQNCCKGLLSEGFWRLKKCCRNVKYNSYRIVGVKERYSRVLERWSGYTLFHEWTFKLPSLVILVAIAHTGFYPSFLAWTFAPSSPWMYAICGSKRPTGDQAVSCWLCGSPLPKHAVLGPLPWLHAMGWWGEGLAY